LVTDYIPLCLTCHGIYDAGFRVTAAVAWMADDPWAPIDGQVALFDLSATPPW
jgi:hypothetical protein